MKTSLVSLGRIAPLNQAVERARQSILAYKMFREDAIREIRRSFRVEPLKSIWVEWQGSGQRFLSPVCDLNLGGAFLPISDFPPVGTIVRLTFELAEGEVYVPAIVRSTVPGGGMCVDFAAAEDGALLRILQSRRELVH
jgi:hypothetical protein